jgi:hypothetical protein
MKSKLIPFNSAISIIFPPQNDVWTLDIVIKNEGPSFVYDIELLIFFEFRNEHYKREDFVLDFVRKENRELYLTQENKNDYFDVSEIINVQFIESQGSISIEAKSLINFHDVDLVLQFKDQDGRNYFQILALKRNPGNEQQLELTIKFPAKPISISRMQWEKCVDYTTSEGYINSVVGKLTERFLNSIPSSRLVDMNDDPLGIKDLETEN